MRTVRAFLLLALLPHLAPAGAPACCPHSRDGRELQLRDRVRAYWDARMAADHEGMYELFEPSFRRRVSLVKFVEMNTIPTRFPIDSYRIAAVTVEGERAVVEVEYAFRVPQLPEQLCQSNRGEWVEQDGIWYRVFVPSRLPFDDPRNPGG